MHDSSRFAGHPDEETAWAKMNRGPDEWRTVPLCGKETPEGPCLRRRGHPDGCDAAHAEKKT